MKICKQCGTEYKPFGVTVVLCRDCWLPYRQRVYRRHCDNHREKIRDNRRMWARKTWALYTRYVAEHPDAKRRFLPDQGQLRMAYVRDCAQRYLLEHPHLGSSIGKARV